MARNGSGGRVDFNSDSLYLYNTGGADNHAAVFTTNPIDLTKYTKLHARVNPTYVSVYSMYCCVGITTNGAATAMNTQFAAYTDATVTGEQILTIDLSSLSGNYYVGVKETMSTMYVYEIWLE